MANPSNPPPSVTGPQAGEAKPSQPGPPEPETIAASILPQRQRDAARHPDRPVEAAEAVQRPDDLVAAAQSAVETSQGRDKDDDDDDNAG